MNWSDYLKEAENPVKVTFKNGAAIKVEKDTISNVYRDFYCSDSGYVNKIADELYHYWTIERNNEMMSTLRKCYNDIMGANDSTKENKDMLTITNYKYDEKTATTTIFWSDKSQSSVTADNVSEATEFEGFCAACAKKLFGNRSTYLNQFDKWTVKIPARQRAEAERKAERKAAEERELAERNARRAAKKEERRRQRLIDDIAKSIVDDYNTPDIIKAAEKRAIEEYGVPSDYIANRNNCECDCCKEQE